MKNLIFLILGLFAISAHAQQSFIEKYNLPQYDCEQRCFRNLEKSNLTIVVPNDSTDISRRALSLESYGKSKNMAIKIRTESQLLEDDFKNALWILGPIDRFSDWGKFSLPVGKIKMDLK